MVMKIRYIVLAVLTLAFVTNTSAKSRKKKKAETTEVVRFDTVTVDKFSYAMGIAQSGGLKNYVAQRMGVDTAFFDHFLRGLSESIRVPDDKKMQAYAAGIQIGKQVMEQILPGVNRQITDREGVSFLDEEQFKTGFLAGLGIGTPTMSTDSAMNVAQRQMNYYQAQLTEKKFGQNREEGEKFLKENAKKDSVKTLKTGLQYKVLKKGTGSVPTEASTVKVNYEGKLIDGTIFDSSYQRGEPATFGCTQVIKGWTEALTNMPVGSVWEIYIPQEKAYGARQAGKIPPFSTLIFKVELLGIE